MNALYPPKAAASRPSNRLRGHTLAGLLLFAAAVIRFEEDLGSGEPDRPSAVINPEWPQLYQPIESPEAEAFVKKALEWGIQRLGEPKLKISKVQLRLSQPRDPAASIAKGFRLTELSNSKEGILTIYVNARPGEPNFYGQLGHEVFHLFEPRFLDIYIEGLNTWLTSKLFVDLGLTWEAWEKHFQRGEEPVYGETYFLMNDLEKIAGEKSLYKIFHFSSPRKKPGAPAPAWPGQAWIAQQVDIDSWIDSLAGDQRDLARQAILRRYPRLEAGRLKTLPDLSFQKPMK